MLLHIDYQDTIVGFESAQLGDLIKFSLKNTVIGLCRKRTMQNCNRAIRIVITGGCNYNGFSNSNAAKNE